MDGRMDGWMDGCARFRCDPVQTLEEPLTRHTVVPLYVDSRLNVSIAGCCELEIGYLGSVNNTNTSFGYGYGCGYGWEFPFQFWVPGIHNLTFWYVALMPGGMVGIPNPGMSNLKSHDPYPLLNPESSHTDV